MRNLTVMFVAGALAATASAQLVVGNDQSSASIWHQKVPTGEATSLYTGTEATTWGMAYDGGSNTLYWNNGGKLYKSVYSQAGLTPVFVGDMKVGGSAMNVTGMAYDAKNNKLLGYRSITTPGFYEISVTDASCTLVNATPSSTDFGGFDYDAGTGKFYGNNDSTGLQGRGLYEIADIYGAPTYTRLTAYPGTDTDIDGLAVGGGKAYMVNDAKGMVTYVFDLAGGAFDPNIPLPFTGSGIFAGAAYVPEPASMLLLVVALVAARRR